VPVPPPPAENDRGESTFVLDTKPGTGAGFPSASQTTQFVTQPALADLPPRDDPWYADRLPAEVGVNSRITAATYSPLAGASLPEWRPDLTDLALGQKSVIWAILLNLIAIAVTLAVLGLIGPVGMFAGGGWVILSRIVSLVSFALSLWGVHQMIRSLGASGLYYVAMLIPLVSLFALLILNARATSRLKAAGYKVGLLGCDHAC
jgi:hypothetical protein